jgi:dTDP-4-amino-4,6-dideoxygalactose transaminase
LQFIDLKKQYSLIKEDVDAGIMAVLNHGQYIMGPEITKLENQLAEFTGTKYCVGCSSGTDALLMPLMAWGIGAGDVVFTTPFTFIATAEVVALLGATVVFVDVDPDTFNISPEKLEEAIINIRTNSDLNPRLIIPVDLFGLPADYDKIGIIAEKYGLLLLEDAAQGFGGLYKGRRAGSFGDAGATSFFPAKPLGCYGDGGAVFTNNENLFEKLISVRVHGQGTDRYENVRIGINGRLDAIQAAVLLAKLKIFDQEIASRNRVASKYIELLKGKIKTPFIPEDCTSVWAQFSVLAENTEQRTAIMTHLKENGIPSTIYYPIPLHLQRAFADLNYKHGDFPVSESLSERIFSLPMHPYLTDGDIEKITDLF